MTLPVSAFPASLLADALKALGFAITQDHGTLVRATRGGGVEFFGRRDGDEWNVVLFLREDRRAVFTADTPAQLRERIADEIAPDLTPATAQPAGPSLAFASR